MYVESTNNKGKSCVTNVKYVCRNAMSINKGNVWQGACRTKMCVCVGMSCVCVCVGSVCVKVVCVGNNVCVCIKKSVVNAARNPMANELFSVVPATSTQRGVACRVYGGGGGAWSGHTNAR